MSFLSKIRFMLFAAAIFSLACGPALAQGAEAPGEAPMVEPVVEAPQPEAFQVGDLVLKAPPGWYQGDIEQTPDKDEVKSVLASDEEGRAMMLVTIEPTRGRSLDALQTMTRHYIIMKMDGLVEYEKKKRINGKPALVMVYEGSSAVTEQGRRKFMRTVIEKDGYFYILQGIADHSDFAAQAGTLEMLANSANWIE